MTKLALGMGRHVVQELRQLRHTLDRIAAALEHLRDEVLALQLGDDRLVPLKQIADLLGVSERTVRRLDQDEQEPLRLVKIAGQQTTSLGQLRRYQREKLSALPTAGTSSGKSGRSRSRRPALTERASTTTRRAA